MHLPRRKRDPKRGAGQSLVEFALVLPVLLLLVLVAVDFGRMLYGWIILQNSARIAANFAGVYPEGWEGSGDAAIVAEYETLIENDLDTANCTAAPTPPAPTFQDGPDTFVAGGYADTAFDVGDTVSVSLDCTFRPLTPIIAGVVGADFHLGARSEFRIRAGDIVGLANPTRMPAPSSSGAPSASSSVGPSASTTCSVAVNFTADDTSGSGGTHTVNFTSSPVVTGSCTISSYAWDFGDGFSSTQANPTHTFTKTRGGPRQQFTIRLTVTLSNGTSGQQSRNNYIEVLT